MQNKCYNGAMAASLKFEGIYDLRTLNCLKTLLIKDLSFDFSPKSFNFLQSKVFLKELLPRLTDTDIVYLKFDHVFDPIIDFLLEEMKTSNVKKENIYLEFNFFDKSYFSQKFSDYKFLFSYFDPYFNQLKMLESCAGVIIECDKIVELEESGLIMNFVTNFHAQIASAKRDNFLIEMKMDWESSITPSFIELMDIDLVSFKINSNVEVCYRNVDLEKIEKEITKLIKLN